MAGNSIGSIFLDLGLNTKSFNKELQNTKQIANKAGSSISSSFSKLGGIIAGALSVAAVVKFGQECVKAYNAQNEAEVKLTTVMKQRMNANSEMINSVKALAIQEQKLGVIGDEVALAGTQQLATFMNNTDALKTLMPAMNNLLAQQKGVNATQQDAVNIGNLMGKVMQGQTSALKRVGISFSEAEENILKYGNEQQRAAMLAKVITNNVGQMNQALANTPQGQIQQLKNNFGDLKEQLGSLVSLALVPILKVLNQIIVKLMQAATAAKQFIMNFLGIEDNTTELPSVVSDSADSMADMADNTEDETKEAKKLKSVLAGFDKLNLLNFDEDSDSSLESLNKQLSGIDSLNDANGKDLNKTVNITTNETTNHKENWFTKVFGQEKVDNFLKNTKAGLKEIGTQFAAGFKTTLKIGNFDKSMEGIKTAFKNISIDLSDIFSDEDVKKAAKDMVDKFCYFLGSFVGGLVAIGAAWVYNILAGFSGALHERKEWIKEQLVKIFNNISFTLDDLQAFWDSLVEIITTAFQDPSAIGISEDIFAIAITLTVGSITLATDFVKDVILLFTKPITDNKDKIEKNISETLATIKPGFDTLKEEIQKLVDKMEDSMKNHIDPFFKALADKASENFGNFNDDYNKKAIPALDGLKRKFQIATIAIGYFFDDLKTINDFIFDTFTVNIENDWKPAMLGMKISFNAARISIANGLGDLLEKWGANKTEVAAFKAVLKDELLPTFDETKIALDNMWTVLKNIGGFFIQTLPECVNNWKTGMEEIKKAWNNGVADIFTNIINFGKDAVTGKNGLGQQFVANVVYSNIPKHAKGGVITQPQLAMIGERGAEVVMPLEQNTGWIDVLANKLAGIINTNNKPQTSSVENSRPIEIILQLGDTKFGRAVINSINQAQNQAGKILLQL